MKDLSHKGIVASHCHADKITLDHENLMWEHGVLGSNQPKQLVSTLLYMFGIHFALCAGAEHCALRVGDNSQITELFDGQFGLKYLYFVEDFAKNRQGGIV